MSILNWDLRTNNHLFRIGAVGHRAGPMYVVGTQFELAMFPLLCPTYLQGTALCLLSVLELDQAGRESKT